MCIRDSAVPAFHASRLLPDRQRSGRCRSRCGPGHRRGHRRSGERLPRAQLALLGDSGMMNAGWDISVAVDYKLPIVYLVTNNGGWMPGMKYAYYGPNWDVLGPQDRYGAEWM